MGAGRTHVRDALRVSYLNLDLTAVYRYPPFYDSNPYDIYRRIAVGYFEFPDHVEISARQLISGLLE